MTPERFQRIDLIFAEACKRPVEHRRSFVEQACAGDEGLLAQVCALLEHDAQPQMPLEPLLLNCLEPAEALAETSDGGSPPRIGAYRIIGVLGRGGMGMVYEAEQDKPRRRVALKVIRPGLAPRQLMRRFEHEAEILGQLHHPGIAHIYEAGIAEVGDQRQPYFAMELIRGTTLTTHAQEKGLNVRQRLALFAQVCDAVHYAHQCGIVHRDLKPANILVDDGGQPKILDFGVARAMDADHQQVTALTDVGQLVGTLAYMSPEQISADPQKIDLRSDVYALGVICYELLAGTLPYEIDARSIPQAVQIICDRDPARLSSINLACRGDVDAIVSKAIEKEPGRRYPSAVALAEDIRRYLSNEPVVARAPGLAYQVWKLVRRNRTLAVMLAVLFVVLLAGLASTHREYRRAERARAAEQDQRIRAEDLADRERLARAQAQQAQVQAQDRADRLKRVTEFLQAMIGDVNAHAMGRDFIDTLRARAVAGIAERGDPADAAGVLAGFDQAVGAVNATDLALDLMRKHMLANAVAAIDRDMAGDPLARAALQQAVADTYTQLGLYTQALPLAREACATRRRMLGDEDPDTVESLWALGQLLLACGSVAEAEHCLRDALVISRGERGDEYGATVRILGRMGHLLLAGGRLQEALDCYEQALAGSERVFGPDHPQTIALYNRIGMVLETRGDSAGAQRCYAQALADFRRTLGSEHPQTLAAINNLAVVLKRIGRSEEAWPLYLEALEGSRRLLGDQHSDTLRLLDNMGSLLLGMRRYDEAESYCRRALSGFIRTLGEDHPSAMTSRNNLGILLTRAGRRDEALVLLQQNVTLAERVLPPGHWHLAVFRLSYGQCLTELQQFTEAERHLLIAVKALDRALGPQHAQTIGGVMQLVELYDAWIAAAPDPSRAEAAAHWRHRLQ